MADDVNVCRRCGEVKPRDEFWASSTSRDGLQGWRKKCRTQFKREWRARNHLKVRQEVYEAHLRRNYGITLAEYEAMFASQRGLCAMCGQPETARNRDGTLRRLHVDHDHKTNRVRSLLCSGCNTVLGYVEANRQRLRAVEEYLRKWASDDA